MKRINKILFLFLFFCFATVYGGWKFIHSKKFSEQASIKFSEILTKKFGAKLSFEQVEFGVLPPSTTFKKVRVHKNEENKINLDLTLDSLTVMFSYASFLSSNLEIDEVVLSRGKVDLSIVDDPTKPDIEWKKIKLNELFQKYESYYAISPVKLNILRLNEIEANIDKVKMRVSNLVIAPHKKDVRIKIKANSISLDYDVKPLNKLFLTHAEIQGELQKNEWSFESIKISDEQSSLEFKGKIKQAKELEVSGSGQVKTKLENIKTYFTKNLPEDFREVKGKSEFDFNIDGYLFNPNASVSLDLKNFESPWIHLQEASVTLGKKRNVIIVEKVKALNFKEEYYLLHPAGLYDLSKNTFLKSTGNFEVKNVFTNNFLLTIKDSLDVFKGTVTGFLDITWDGEKVSFNVKNKTILKDFQLVFPKANKPLLKNQGFIIENALITLDKKNNVGIDAKVSMANSILNINGVIAPKDISIIVSDSKIDMNSFGPISGVNVHGSGPVDLKINGPYDDVRFDFNVNWKNFGLLDLNFGEVKSHFTLSLSDILLSVETMEGKYNNSAFVSSGWLSFGDKSGLDIKFKFPSSNFSDAKKMYALVFKDMKLPSDLDLKFETNYRVFGDFDLQDLKIDGQLKGRELHAYGEDAETIGFNFLLANKSVAFKNIKMRKGRGEVSGSANILLTNNYSEVEAFGSGIRLTDFNFYKKLRLDYDGDLQLEYDGNGTVENYSSRLKFKTNEPFISNFPASSSSGLFYINHDEIISKLNLLGGKLKVDSIYDLAKEQVFLKSNIETQDVKELLGVFSGHNMNDRSITGSVKAYLNTKFNIKNFNISKFNFIINQLKLKRGEVDLHIDPNRNSINVIDGIVKNWDLKFIDGKQFFSSVGKNVNNNSSIVCDQNFSVKANIFELFNGNIEKAKGLLSGTSQVTIDKKITITSFNLQGRGNSLKVKKLPGNISSLDYEINKNGNKYEISKFQGKFGDGDVRVGGYVEINNLIPKINLDFKIDRANMQLYKKSNILFSGSGNLIGADVPYRLIGKTTLLHGEILDEPSEIMNENQVSLDELNQYLPQREAGALSMIGLDIQFDTQDVVAVRNNSAEVFLKAAGFIRGSLASPEVNARVDVSPTISKFKFKGHDFLLSQGYVEIHDKEKQRNSELKFSGLAKVNDYDIKLDITGSLKKTDLVLSSDKLTSKDEILGLLVTGTTHEINRGLNKQEQSSVATVSMATTMSEVLGFNQSLNSTLGLNLSIAPEFQEDETASLITGKLASGESSTSKLKSATKIKVKKQISSSVDVSVSSTVGGSIEQKQDMNINWNLNKQMSLEGVYEIKPAEADTSNATPSSIGADLKFKWSF